MNSFVVEGVSIIDAIKNGLKIAGFPESFDIKVLDKGVHSIFWWKNKPTVILFSYAYSVYKKAVQDPKKKIGEPGVVKKKNAGDCNIFSKEQSIKKGDNFPKKNFQKEENCHNLVGQMLGQSTVSLLSKEKINQLSLEGKKNNSNLDVHSDQSIFNFKKQTKKNITDFCNPKNIEKNCKLDIDNFENKKKAVFFEESNTFKNNNQEKKANIQNVQKNDNDRLSCKSEDNKIEFNKKEDHIGSSEIIKIDELLLQDNSSDTFLKEEEQLNSQYIEKIEEVCNQYLKKSIEKKEDNFLLESSSSLNNKKFVDLNNNFSNNLSAVCSNFFTSENIMIVENWINEVALYLNIGVITVEYSEEKSILFIRVSDYREFEGVKKKYLYSSIMIFLHDHLKKLNKDFEPSKYKIIIE